jgi:hypothetical protein
LASKPNEVGHACPPALEAGALASVSAAEGSRTASSRAAACAQFRALPGLILLATAEPRRTSPKDERALRIWALQEQDLKAVAGSQVLVQEDAAVKVDENGLRFAAPPLALSATTWAVSLDFKNGYQPNCGVGSIDFVRTVLAFDGHELQPVLDDLVVESRHYRGGPGDRCGPDGEGSAATRGPRTERTIREVSLGRGVSHGLRDLSITTRVTGQGRRTSRTELWRFDGQRYRPVPNTRR